MDYEKEFMDCTLCPRECHVDRVHQVTGFCRVDATVRIARAALHMWEEPCISGEEGSGTVFFTGCSLGCAFCQNFRIAKENEGKAVTVERLSEIFLELQEKKANNINLVTGEHFAPRIAKAIRLARENGLFVPVLYNSSGYEKVETLRLLEGLVDIYLPDFKYFNDRLAWRYSKVKDYREVASAAIEEMVRQVGPPEFDDRGMMKKGVIVRHLLLPGYLPDSRNVVKYLYETYGDKIYISLMDQYTPMPAMRDDPKLCRKVTEAEYDALLDYALKIGVENGFMQEGDTASESFIPDFDFTGVE